MKKEEEVMKISPVSFKSIMVFTLNDGKPKAPVMDLVRTAFEYNPALQSYSLDKDNFVFEDKVNGAAYNASTNFTKFLDRKYSDLLPKGSNRVIATEADFYSNTRDHEKRYFLTAATKEDEERIHKCLSKSKIFYAARFSNKKG